MLPYSYRSRPRPQPQQPVPLPARHFDTHLQAELFCIGHHFMRGMGLSCAHPCFFSGCLISWGVLVSDCFVVATQPDSPCQVVINNNNSVNVGITDAANPTSWANAVNETCVGLGFLENSTEFIDCSECLDTTSQCLYGEWALLIAGLVLFALTILPCFYCCCCASPEGGYGNKV